MVGGGGGGYSDFFIRRLGSLFWFEILKFNIFGGFQKKKNFLGGLKILWIFFGVITKLDYILGVISMHFCVFT